MKRCVYFTVCIVAVVILVSILAFLFHWGESFESKFGYLPGISSPRMETSSWDPSYILTFNGHRYTVSTSQVAGVGSYLGAVSYHGSHSGVFNLYAIPNVLNYVAIAVQTRSGYLLAVENR